MKRLFVMLFVAFLAVPAMAQTYEIKTPYVSVNGYAEQEILPDEVYVQITLTESDSKGKITLEQQRRQMFSALKKCKIDVEKQLSMLDMASTYFKRRTSLASARYELKVGSAMEAQQVFEALDAVGISNVDITKVACSREEEYRAAVRKAAMQDARQKASEMTMMADTQAKELRRVANEYVDDMLHRLEDIMTETLESTRKSRQQFKSLNNKQDQ